MNEYSGETLLLHKVRRSNTSSKILQPVDSDHVKLSYLIVFIVSVNEYSGETLSLHKVRRNDMGSFLCIASNGVLPIVSKRILLNVNCKLFINQFLSFGDFLKKLFKRWILCSKLKYFNIIHCLLQEFCNLKNLKLVGVMHRM